LLLVLAACTHRLQVLKTDSGPASLVLDPRGRSLYVGCEAARTVVALDLEKRKITARAAVGAGPLRLYYSRESQLLRVFCQASRSLWVFSVPDLRLQKRVSLAAAPSAWAFYPERRMDVLCSPETNKLHWFEEGAPLSPLEVGRAPADLLLEPGTDRLWVANAQGRTLTLVHLENNHQLSQIPVHANPIRLEMPPTGGTLYVLCTGRDEYPSQSVVQMVDLPNQKAGLTYPAGVDARDFSLGPLGKCLYVVTPAGHLVRNLLNDKTALIPSGRDPKCVAVSPDGARAYVASRAEDAVYVHTLPETFR
jgi:DNA-binding beta-propeller fold protein YncE